MAKKIVYKRKKSGKRGPLCSGYNVFPDGKKCPGCADCVGRNRIKDPLALLEKRMFILTKKSNKKARR
ncbi:hypothetical protein Pedsa_0886 [Pseudopedobacter saltans DSM 12145]|uniref:Uncharacterized protein n=1 Tax=Pseudopedobacter saltans (strain ATCC 51119 / DSM 12145 / JCM 21818 / CCUG 39354 / LMG 10337 / NBRC 100064 / NCIMB 13643) TaxID=762903 RepID=F0SA81_PSESL|nr:hypothetical protein Pedsa_0886 [Pseudopedobacter saltans DSM 12145]